MCIIAAKYFKDVGWVGVKNRDRKYKPTVHIKQSHRKGVERMYIWDEKTKYTEGINEHGLCIISTAIIGKIDNQESEFGQANEDPNFQSPDGKSIRTALYEKNPKAAANYLVTREIEGNTLVFNKEDCFLIEGMFEDKAMRTGYKYEVRPIPQDEAIVRTNHLHWLPGNPMLQTEPDKVKKEKASYKSSEMRYKRVVKDIKSVSNWKDMLDCVSYNQDPELNFNPLRQPETHGSTISHTTGQLMVVPELCTLHYKPLWGDVVVDFNKLNSTKTKTFCEIISNKKMLTFEESKKGHISFKEFWSRDE